MLQVGAQVDGGGFGLAVCLSAGTLEQNGRTSSWRLISSVAATAGDGARGRAIRTRLVLAAACASICSISN